MASVSQPTRGQRFRVVGSGFTVFAYQGSNIKFASAIAETSPSPVAPSAAIQPLDEPHPIEIVTARAVGHGELTLAIFEEWDREVVRQFAGYGGNFVINSLLDILNRSAEIGGVQCMKIINPPPPHRSRKVIYHGARIVDADLSDGGGGGGGGVTIGSMVPTKTVTIWYTHTTRVGG